MILRGPAADADAGDQDRYLCGSSNRHHKFLIGPFAANDAQYSSRPDQNEVRRCKKS